MHVGLRLSCVGPSSARTSPKRVTPKTLSITRGSAPTDFDELFASLEADSPHALEAVHDMANMPLEAEPQRVRDELDAVRAK